MASIAFITEHHRFPWERQLTDRTPSPGEMRFTINRVDADCELLVVYDDLAEPIPTVIPRERRMAILSEPPGIKTYRSSYLAQFGSVFGPVDPKRADVRWIKSHPALPWFYGIGFNDGRCVANESLDAMMAMAPPAKAETVSVVISSKSRLPMHRQRMKFVTALKERLGSKLHIFGQGFNPIADKADAISPHAYHLVLENNNIDHFWTEKTADAFLGWSLPIVSACANLEDYFPPESFVRIDPDDIERAVETTLRVLDQSPYAARLPALAEARQRLTQQYELSVCLRHMARALPKRTAAAGERPARLHPNRNLGPAGKLEPFARKIARKLVRRSS